MLAAEIRAACRSFFGAVVQATTTSTMLSATATGYHRADGGSFLTDGFTAGSELSAAGFGTAANNGLSVLVAVTASDLTVVKTPAPVVEAAGAAVTLSIGLPTARFLEGHTGTPTPIPTVGVPYWSDAVLRAPLNSSQRISVGIAPALRRHTGLYQMLFAAPADLGPAAAEGLADACRELAEATERVQMASGLWCYFHNPAAASGRQTDRWWTVPFTVAYRVDTIH